MLSEGKRWASCLALLAVTACAQETPAFHASVSLVHVDAEVVSAGGRIISGLHRNDFRVFDEGALQPVLHFSEGEEALDLILLFDVSGSMRSWVQELGEAAREGVRALREGDRVSIMAFNRRSFVIAPFTTDLLAVERSIHDQLLSRQFGGQTFIQTAVSDAAGRLLREPHSGRRRAILVITDNYGQRTRREGTVVRELWEADAVLSVLILRTVELSQKAQKVFNVTHPLIYELQVGVEKMAEQTGGDAIHARDVGPGFQESMRRIRSRYTLYYALPGGAKPGSRRAVRVALSPEADGRNPGARILARAGYIVPARETGAAPR